MSTGSSRPAPTLIRSMVLIDGENILSRFEAMKKDRTPVSGLEYIPNLLVWHRDFIQDVEWQRRVRVSYYTTVVGDEDAVVNAREQIAKLIHFGGGHGLRICPFVFKKPKREEKTKNVDIAITIDALRAAYQDQIDQLYLFSGDGDYIPLVHEVMRQGKRVIIGAFSSGLNPELKRVGDGFIDFDACAFD